MKYTVYIIIIIITSIANISFGQYQDLYKIYQEDGKFGLKDARQKIMVKPIYKDIKSSKFGIFAMQSEEQKWAIFDKRAIQVTDFVYDRMEQKLPNIVEVSQGSLVGLISESGQQLVAVKYDKIAPVGKVILTEMGSLSNSMQPSTFIYRGSIVTRLGLSGFVNKSDQTVLDVIYERIRSTAAFELELGFVDVVGLVVTKNGKYGIVNEDGQSILPVKYDYINALNKLGFGELQKNGKKGIYNKKLKVVAKPNYDDLKILNKGLYAGKKETKWLIQSTDGSSKIYEIVDNIRPFDNGYIQVSKDGKVSILKDDGKLKVPFEYDKAIPFGRNVLLIKGDENYLYDSKGRVKYWEYPMDISWQNLGEKLKPIKADNQKWGYINDDGELKVKAVYDKACVFKESVAIVCKGDLCGFIDDEGWKLTPLEYELPDLEAGNEVLLAKKEGKVGYLNHQGKSLISVTYDELFNYGFIIKAKKNGKWGFINKNEKVLISMEYDFIEDYSSNKSEFRFQNEDKIGWLDKNGRQRIGNDLVSWADAVDVVDETIKSVRVDNYYGLVHQNGKWIVPISYENEIKFDKFGKAIVRKNESWGMIDKAGNIVIPTIYQDKIKFDNNQLACVRKSEKYGIVNYNGKIIIPAIYDTYIYSDYEFWTVQQNGKFGMINKKGKIVIPVEYEKVFPYDVNNLALVKKNGKWGCIDEVNRAVIPFEYEVLNSFINGRALAKRSDYWGIVDIYNKILLPFKYDNLIVESNGFVNVNKRGFWGVLDERFNVLIPIEYDQIDVLNDYFKVERNNKIGLFTKNGEMLLPAFYDGLTVDSYGLKVRKGGKYGLLKSDGEVIIPVIYDELMHFNDGFSRVKKGNYYGMISEFGNLEIPCEYDNLGLQFRGDFVGAYKNNRWGVLNKRGKTVIRFRYEKIRWLTDTMIEGYVNGIWKKIEI